MKKFVHAIDGALAAAVSVLLVLLFFIMLCLSAVQIGMRYFLESGIPWADIAARNLVLWVGLLGAVMATRQTKHFQLDILTRFLSDRVKLWFDSFAELFASVVCFFLVQASIRFVDVGLEGTDVAYLGIPISVVALIIPIAFGLMAIQFAIRSLESMWENHGRTFAGKDSKE